MMMQSDADMYERGAIEGDVVVVRLYVAPASSHSSAAVRNLNAFCSSTEGLRVDIEIVDVVADPERALAEGIFLTPVLVRLVPGSQRILIGSLSDRAALRAFFE